MNNLKNIIKQIIFKILPATTVVKLKKIVNQTKLRYFLFLKDHKESSALKRVRGKHKIKVTFFVIHDAVWKFDQLYKMMKKSKLFDPVIVVCPYITFGDEVMHRDMERTYNFFASRNYTVISSYIGDDNWLDVKRVIDPDIVFFTNPHKLTRKQYYITNYLDRLTCYSQYSFHISHLNEIQYNQLFHNLLWRAFYETDIHYQIAAEHSSIQAKNVRVTGYPGVDGLLLPESSANDCWKLKDRRVKRIIWAPHHTILDDEPLLNWSCFLDYSSLMLDLLTEFEGRLQICFKPHPLLRPKLEKLWGKDRSDIYFETWAKRKNGFLAESDYINLFLTSDAMIHDSGSFLVEYLFVNKPVLYTVKNKDINDSFNRYGKMAFALHYQAFCIDNIRSFVNQIVNDENDPLMIDRKNFIDTYKSPLGDNTASELIYNELVNTAKAEI